MLNVYKPMMRHNLLHSARLLTDSLPRLSHDQCVDGLSYHELAAIGDHLENSLMLVTALNNHIGYDMAARSPRRATRKAPRCVRPPFALNALTEEQFDAWVRPRGMTGPV